MDKSLKQLVAKRTSIKSQLNHFQSFINDLDKTNPSQLMEMQIKLQKLIARQDQFDNIQLDIEVATDNDPEQFDIREEIEHLFETLIIQSKDYIAFCENKRNINDIASSENVKLRGIANVKLPPIELPSFDGDYTNWRSFEDSFMAFVDKNSSLSNVEKLCYLRSKLKNEAWELIKSLDTTSENYEIALGLIKERFDHYRKIVYSHVNALLTMKFYNAKSYINAVDQHVRSLQSLKIPIASSDAILIPLLISKLDQKLVREWENKIVSFSKNTLPTYDDFRSFMFLQAEVADITKDIKHITKSGPQNTSNSSKLRTIAYYSTSEIKCPLCQDKHFIYQCQRLLKQDIHERIKTVKSLRLCLNCLRKGHFSQNCTSSKCKVCKISHNTILHLNKTLTSAAPSESSNVKDHSDVPSSTIANCATKITSSHVLLSTAEVLIPDSSGTRHTARVLLDSASQSHFITKHFFSKLNIPKHNIDIHVSGIGKTSSNINHCATVTLHSRCTNYSTSLSCLLIDTITENIPYQSFPKTLISIPQGINLADDHYNESRPIDLLLGANKFWELIMNGYIQLDRNGPILKNTTLGWILSGPIPIYQHRILTHTVTSIENQIQALWNLDEFSAPTTHFSESETYCNELFLNTTHRDPSGRLVVTIPFKENCLQLGDSKTVALKRFYSLERRFQREPELKENYVQFMREYIKLNHMTKLNSSNLNSPHYFLPHHPIIKNSSSTTKLRVVFDGSQKTDNGISLNDVQHTGPALQADIFAILLRFRQHTYIVTSDVEKMYRQILIEPNQRCYQQILWRESPSDVLDIYELNTVTYGTASAPFLAVRCLQYLADENHNQFPIESQVIKSDIYVDDLLTGCDSIDELKTICNNIYKIFQKAGFILRKWSSNTLDLNGGNIETDKSIVVINQNSEHKTLGIKYDPVTDAFCYSLSETIQLSSIITKRCILKTASKIFDPLGLISPVTIIPKILIQRTWKEHLDWDQPVSDSIRAEWINFLDSIQSVKSVHIPRHVFVPNSQSFCLHGFADASEIAYGACVYIQSIQQDGSFICNLITAKSKVAPIKNVTIPRLELCAAVLLARLMNRVQEVLTHKFDQVFYWSDSKIVLCWIQGSSYRWKTFVANRVAEIQRLSNINRWFHVNSSNNPADLITRGSSLKELVNHEIWWHGPQQFLTTCHYDQQMVSVDHIPEQKMSSLPININFQQGIFDRYSNLNKLVNIIAYSLRFISNCKNHVRLTGELKVTEREASLILLLKLAQQENFNVEYHQLKHDKSIESSSSLLTLNPFLDDNGLIRVGGRLNNAEINYDKKHQILLPKNHKFTELIARDLHIKNLHCGSQQLLYLLREKYWPISGYSLVKRITRMCIICFKYQPRSNTQLMGSLPTNRITPSPPFSYIGVDYAGPFFTKERRSRGNHKSKTYLCLFICFSTKAIHLEFVTNLTTECFIAALRRFISRRGKPRTIYSDNATNFTRANKELQNLYRFLNVNHSIITRDLANSGIEWKFIPPRSPNFGGIWEAHIKSIKRHLLKTVGNTVLTIEEFYTLIVQIEAVVNSRPISPLSNDPTDLNPLTPAHFLIGRSLVAAPDEDLDGVQENRLSYHQRIQALVQSYWKRWHQEYIHHLQHRPKWQRVTKDIFQIGSLVLLKEDRIPPGLWKMGRIVQVWPGSDGHVRVVSVQTQNNIVKRGITKLCVLPMQNIN